MEGRQQAEEEIYDDEAFIGMEEGQIVDGKVLDDLDPEGDVTTARLPLYLSPLPTTSKKRHLKTCFHFIRWFCYNACSVLRVPGSRSQRRFWLLLLVPHTWTGILRAV
jgi:hypothetical protein